jgi:hypothetical protein
MGRTIKSSAAMSILIFGFLWACFTISACKFLHGGYPQHEIYIYIPHYISDAPLLTKLWDPQSTEEDGFYQPRELSYLFDYFDCQFIDLSARLGFPHLMSISFFAFMLIIVLAARRLLMEYLGFGLFGAVAAVCILLTTPFFFLTGIYFRSAKIGVGMCVMLAALEIAKGLRRNKFPAGSMLRLLVIALCMVWFDLQGFYFAAMFSILLGFYARRKRSRTLAYMAAIFAVAVVVFIPYDLWISPAICYHFQDYWPSFGYQSLPWLAARLAPDRFVLNGFKLTENTLSQMLGGWSRVYVGIVLLFAVFLAFTRKHLEIAFIILIAMMTAMYAVMALRHPPILEAHAREASYYCMPAAVVMFICIFLSLPKRMISSWRWSLLIWLFVILNVVAIPYHWQTARREMPWIEDGKIAIAAMDDGVKGHVPNDLKERNNILFWIFLARYNPEMANRLLR